MSDRLPWFRCFPSALLGALAGLDADEGIVYVTALLRIYETGAPVGETARTLGRRTGLTERKAGAALERLFEAGKLILTADGKLDSASTHAEIGWQRERHQDQSAAGRASAARRQKQVDEKKNEAFGKSSAQNEDQKHQQNQRNEATAVELPFNHLEEDTDQKEDKPLSDARVARSQSDFPPSAFAIWWQIQPNKVGKDAAERAFNRVRKSGRVTFSELVDGLKSYIATKPPTRDWCHPTTWLNQGRWADEPAPVVPYRAPLNGRAPSAQESFLTQSRNADREMRGEDDASPFLFDAAPVADAAGYTNGHARPALLEPPGGNRGFPPPRYPGPARPH
ncbi:hypothetical protein ABC766_00220 [Methylobacterium fujisawaense]|uniref:hypothetical protein n=1 Tax=Methylobacterium fujisawaense TaxID=107400 RepID=UPI0031F59225